MLENHNDELNMVKGFLEKTKGPYAFHLSDTATSQYEYARKLLETVRPELTIHTGDFADEYKVGRLSEHCAGYRKSVPALLKYITMYSQNFICTIGNNDLRECIVQDKNVKVVENGSQFTWDGWTFLVDHIAVLYATKTDYVLFGHGGVEDLRYPLFEPAKKPLYLNGNYYWSVIDLDSGQVCRCPCGRNSPVRRYFIVTPSCIQTDSCIGLRQEQCLASFLNHLSFSGDIYYDNIEACYLSAHVLAEIMGGNAEKRFTTSLEELENLNCEDKDLLLLGSNSMVDNLERYFVERGNIRLPSLQEKRLDASLTLFRKVENRITALYFQNSSYLPLPIQTMNGNRILHF